MLDDAESLLEAQKAPMLNVLLWASQFGSSHNTCPPGFVQLREERLVSLLVNESVVLCALDPMEDSSQSSPLDELVALWDGFFAPLLTAAITSAGNRTGELQVFLFRLASHAPKPNQMWPDFLKSLMHLLKSDLRPPHPIDLMNLSQVDASNKQVCVHPLLCKDLGLYPLPAFVEGALRALRSAPEIYTLPWASAVVCTPVIISSALREPWVVQALDTAQKKKQLELCLVWA